jgi:hypothetical protein
MRSMLAVLVILMLPALASADAVYDRIIQMRDSGEITVDQAALYLAASAVDPSLLPASIAIPDEPGKCATPAVLEAQRMLGQTSAEIAGQVNTMLARPTLSGPELTIDSASGHFKIHYTLSGVDACTAAYAQEVADYADYSWLVEVDQMGYYDPPSDLGLGGDARYDIYVYHQSSLGFTSPDGIPDPTTPWNDTSSYIAIAPGLNTNLNKVTVAHEFCHAVEFAYDVSEPTWFMENTSTWMEDEVYDEINDYWGYVCSGDNPLRKPWWDIREGGTSLYWYAGCIFARYMEIRIDVTAIREIWENCTDIWGPNMLTAQQDMYAAHGMTWEQGFMEYAEWRWFTSVNWYAGCGMYDDEATHWNPGPYVFPWDNVTSLPYSADQGVYPPDTYGIHWIKVNLTNYQSNWVNMHFDGRDGFDWNLGVILWDTAGNHQYYWYPCDAAGVKDVSIRAAGWDYVIFTPALLTDTSLDKYYEYDITATSGIEGEGEAPGLIDLRISENPAETGASAVFSLPTASDAKLVVFDVSGRLVATLFDSQAPAGQSSVSLSGLTSGTYFLRLYADGQIAGRRVTVIQ